jgi:hypothetical protein
MENDHSPADIPCLVSRLAGPFLAAAGFLAPFPADLDAVAPLSRLGETFGDSTGDLE